MDFIKKNIIWIMILLLGIVFIYNCVSWGRSYCINFIVKNNLENQSYSNILLNMSIVKYIVIGVILSILGIKKIEKQ